MSVKMAAILSWFQCVNYNWMNPYWLKQPAESTEAHECLNLDQFKSHCETKGLFYDFFNSLRPRLNERYNADDIFNCIFLKENVWIPTKISLKFVPKGPINNIPALVQIMAWRRSGDKPLSEPKLIFVPTYICATRPQWVKLWKCIFVTL